MRNFLKTYDPANPEISQLPPFAISWGNTAPSNGDGNDGDFYFDYDSTSTDTIYKKISGNWVSVSINSVRLLNSGTNTVTTSDHKLLADTTDASASAILFPVGTDGLTYRVAGVNGGSFSYVVTPNGTDTMDPSAPTIIGAGSIVEYTFLSGIWFAS
jgi:hypothetical protein